MPTNKLDLQDLEDLLSGQDIDLPVNKKSGFHRNISKVQWLHRNFDARNSAHPDRNEIMGLIEDILRDEGLIK